MKFPFIFGCIIGITSCEIEPIYPVNSGGDPFISSSFKLRTNTSEDWDDWRFYLGDSTVTVRTSTSEDWDNWDFSFNWDSGDIRTNTSEDWDYWRLTMSGVDLRIQTRKQVPIVVDSISRLAAGQSLSTKQYNGYSSCPLVTGYGKMVLAEFDYDSNFTPDPKLKQMFIKDSSKEHLRLWWLKKYILPRLYWNKMMKGIDV